MEDDGRPPEFLSGVLHQAEILIFRRAFLDSASPSSSSSSASSSSPSSLFSLSSSQSSTSSSSASTNSPSSFLSASSSSISRPIAHTASSNVASSGDDALAQRWLELAYPAHLQNYVGNVKSSTRQEVDTGLATIKDCLCSLAQQKSTYFEHIVTRLIQIEPRLHAFHMKKPRPSPRASAGFDKSPQKGKNPGKNEPQSSPSTNSELPEMGKLTLTVKNADKFFHATRSIISNAGGPGGPPLRLPSKMRGKGAEGADDPLPEFNATAIHRRCAVCSQLPTCSHNSAELLLALLVSHVVYACRDTESLIDIPQDLGRYCFAHLELEYSQLIRDAVSCSMAVLSRLHLQVFCQMFIKKMSKLKSGDASFTNYLTAIASLDFGVIKIPQINTTILFLTYIKQVMSNVSKEAPREVICHAMNRIFMHVMDPTPDNREAWRTFSQLEDLYQQFWKIYQAIYEEVSRWATKNSKQAIFCMELMVTMVTLAPRAFLDQHGESLLEFLFSVARNASKNITGKEDKGKGDSNDSSTSPRSVEYNPQEVAEKMATLSASMGKEQNVVLRTLRFVLCYLLNLDDGYMVESKECYNRQMQILTKNLFSLPPLFGKEQSVLLINIGITIAKRDLHLAVALVVHQVLKLRNAPIQYKIVCLQVLAYVLRRYPTDAEKYNLFRSMEVLWIEEAEDQSLLRGILSCVPMISQPLAARPKVAQRLLDYSQNFQYEQRTRDLAVDALVYLVVRHPHRLVHQTLSALIATMENDDEKPDQAATTVTDAEERKGDKLQTRRCSSADMNNNLLSNLSRFLTLYTRLATSERNRAIHRKALSATSAAEWQQLRLRLESVCLLWLTHYEERIRDEAFKILEIHKTSPFRFLEDCNAPPLLIDVCDGFSGANTETWHPCLSHLFLSFSKEYKEVISRAWLQLASRDWNAVFQSTDRLPFSAIEFHRLNLWKNHLHFLLWGLRATCLAHSAALASSQSNETTTTTSPYLSSGNSNSSSSASPRQGSAKNEVGDVGDGQEETYALDATTRKSVDNALREIVALLNYSRDTSGCVIDVLKDRKLSKGELGSNYGKLFSCCCELLLRHLRDFDNADNVSKNEKIPPYYTKKVNVEIFSLMIGATSKKQFASSPFMQMVYTDIMSVWLESENATLFSGEPLSLKTSIASLLLRLLQLSGYAAVPGLESLRHTINKAHIIFTFLMSLLRGPGSEDGAPRATITERDASAGGEDLTALQCVITRCLATLLSLHNLSEKLLNDVEEFFVGLMFTGYRGHELYVTVQEGLAALLRHNSQLLPRFVENSLTCSYPRINTNKWLIASEHGVAASQEFDVKIFSGSTVRAIHVAYLSAVSSCLPGASRGTILSHDLLEMLVIVCMLAQTSEDAAIQRLGLSLADAIEIRVAGLEENADSYLCDTFSSVLSEQLRTDRSFRFSQRLAASFPGSTASLISKLSILHPRLSHRGTACLLTNLVPWMNNFGKLVAKPDTVSSGQRILEALFYLSKKIWKSSFFLPYLERLWVGAVTPDTAVASLPSLIEFIGKRLIELDHDQSGIDDDRTHLTRVVCRGVCMFLQRSQYSDLLLECIAARLRVYNKDIPTNPSQFLANAFELNAIRADTSRYATRGEEIAFHFLIDFPLADEVARPGRTKFLLSPYLPLVLQNVLLLHLHSPKDEMRTLARQFLRNLLYAVAGRILNQPSGMGGSSLTRKDPAASTSPKSVPTKPLPTSDGAIPTRTRPDPQRSFEHGNKRKTLQQIVQSRRSSRRPSTRLSLAIGQTLNGNLEDDVIRSPQAEPPKPMRFRHSRINIASGRQWISASRGQSANIAGAVDEALVLDDFDFAEPMMQELLTQDDDYRAIDQVLANLVPSLSKLSLEVRTRWAHLALSWGMLAPYADLAVNSLRIFDLLDGHACLQTAVVEGILPKLLYALLATIECPPSSLRVSPITKPDALQQTILKLLEKHSLSWQLVRRMFEISLLLTRTETHAASVGSSLIHQLRTTQQEHWSRLQLSTKCFDSLWRFTDPSTSSPSKIHTISQRIALVCVESMNVSEEESYLDSSYDDGEYSKKKDATTMASIVNRELTNDLLNLYSARIFKKREPKSLNQLLLTYIWIDFLRLMSVFGGCIDRQNKRRKGLTSASIEDAADTDFEIIAEEDDERELEKNEVEEKKDTPKLGSAGSGSKSPAIAEDASIKGNSSLTGKAETAVNEQATTPQPNQTPTQPPPPPPPRSNTPRKTPIPLVTASSSNGPAPPQPPPRSITPKQTPVPLPASPTLLPAPSSLPSSSSSIPSSPSFNEASTPEEGSSDAAFFTPFTEDLSRSCKEIQQLLDLVRKKARKEETPLGLLLVSTRDIYKSIMTTIAPDNAAEHEGERSISQKPSEVRERAISVFVDLFCNLSEDFWYMPVMNILLHLLRSSHHTALVTALDFITSVLQVEDLPLREEVFASLFDGIMRCSSAHAHLRPQCDALLALARTKAPALPPNVLDFLGKKADKRPMLTRDESERLMVETISEIMKLLQAHEVTLTSSEESRKYLIDEPPPTPRRTKKIKKQKKILRKKKNSRREARKAKDSDGSESGTASSVPQPTISVSEDTAENRDPAVGLNDERDDESKPEWEIEEDDDEETIMLKQELRRLEAEEEAEQKRQLAAQQAQAEAQQQTAAHHQPIESGSDIRRARFLSMIDKQTAMLQGDDKLGVRESLRMSIAQMRETLQQLTQAEELLQQKIAEGVPEEKGKMYSEQLARVRGTRSTLEMLCSTLHAEHPGKG